MSGCRSSLRFPDMARVPCTRDYDHLELHACTVAGFTLLVWSMKDDGKGEIVGGSLSGLFPGGCWPGRADQDA